MNSDRRPELVAGRFISFVFLLLILAPYSARARDHLPRFIQFTVQDADGNFFPIGEVEFCTPDGDCLYADIDRDFPGNFYLPTKPLVPGQAYEVRIYDRNVSVHYELRDWTFRPQDFDPVYDPYVEAEKFLIYARFRGQEDGGLVYRLDTTLNPDWVERKEMPRYTGPDSLPDYPELLATVGMPLMLGGKFGTDGEALGGVDDVHPGLSLSGTWRFHYPRREPERDHWVRFREWGLTYAQNRYEVRQIMAPGRGSDLTFHRLKIHLGLGRMSQSYATQWSAGAQVAVGGVYDGPQLLRYLGQKYNRVGAGAYIHIQRRLFEVGRVDLALSVRTETLYYFADQRPDDFWFGLAPSVSIGLVVF